MTQPPQPTAMPEQPQSRELIAEPQLASTITCPQCSHAKAETMPTDFCQWFYDCEGCGAVLRPKPGDCCVYCSYGTVPCPPVQASGAKGCCG